MHVFSAWVMVVLLLTYPAPAAADHPLAGWWVALDDALGSMTERGLVARTQELLIVDRDGRATGALLAGMTAFDNCVLMGQCESPVRVISGSLDPVPGHLALRQRIDHPIGPFADDVRSDRDIVASVRARMSLGGGTRAIALTHGGAQLVIEAGAGADRRVFARIEPGRLRGLWSIFRASGQPTNPAWRCLLAHATAGEPAFRPLHGRFERVPERIDAAARAAIAIARVADLMFMPVPNERDQTFLPVADRGFTHGMSEEVPGLDPPRDIDERARLEARHGILMRWLGGAVSRAEAERLVGGLGASQPPLGVGEEEMDALRRLVAPGAETNRLFCVAR
jgi:hypothetical protein